MPLLLNSCRLLQLLHVTVGDELELRIFNQVSTIPSATIVHTSIDNLTDSDHTARELDMDAVTSSLTNLLSDQVCVARQSPRI
jgi:hypothetical protein